MHQLLNLDVSKQPSRLFNTGNELPYLSPVGFGCHGGSHIDQAQRGRRGISGSKNHLKNGVQVGTVLFKVFLFGFWIKNNRHFTNPRKFWKDKRGTWLWVFSPLTKKKWTKINLDQRSRWRNEDTFRMCKRPMHQTHWKILRYIVISFFSDFSHQQYLLCFQCHMF